MGMVAWRTPTHHNLNPNPNPDSTLTPTQVVAHFLPRAALAQFDRVMLLARDIANPSLDDPYFPLWCLSLDDPYFPLWCLSLDDPYFPLWCQSLDDPYCPL